MGKKDYATREKSQKKKKTMEKFSLTNIKNTDSSIGQDIGN